MKNASHAEAFFILLRWVEEVRTVMGQNYRMLRGIIIENSLENKDVLKLLQIVRTWQDGDWILHDVSIDDTQIPLLSKTLTDGPWYMHFWDSGTGDIRVVYRNKVFDIQSADKSTWTDAVAYGKSIGIPERQLDFVMVQNSQKPMAVEIVFEAHGTTFDNEAHLASGHNDVALSQLGEQQSIEMGERYKNDHFDAIFCSDLQRAYTSAEIGFDSKWPIIKDARLRECDYGDLTQNSSEIVDEEKPARIVTPFPNGESYTQTTARMKDFLTDLLKDYDGKRVMIIGHRATQYGLDNLINHISLEQLTSTHFKWQPGWSYTLTEIQTPRGSN